MAAGHDLQHWLSDAERQRATRRAVDGFAQRWNAGAVQHRFEEAFATLPAQTAEAVADAAAALFADEAWVDVLIAGLTAELAVDPYFEPPFRAINSDIHSGLIVFEDERVTIAAGVTGALQLAAKKNTPRAGTSIGFTGRMTVLKFVKAGDAVLSFWEAPEITPAFTAADAGRCRPAGERRLADGDILVIDGRRQGYVIERARASLLVLQAEINLDQAPVSVEYDSATLGYAGCSANGDGASRIQMIATLLRKLGGEGAFEAMAPFLDHSDFFVRWHVMREMLGVDGERALPHLRRMAARDPHREPRRAARAALDRLEAPKPRKAA
jgi:hypothetical protein